VRLDTSRSGEDNDDDDDDDEVERPSAIFSTLLET
jgi:hypothetical protein